jgi:hypothetical protein
MGGTYITDITHYLGKDGELAEMPGEARKLASFLVLLIDVTTQAFPASDHDTHIRAEPTPVGDQSEPRRRPRTARLLGIVLNVGIMESSGTGRKRSGIKQGRRNWSADSE